MIRTKKVREPASMARIKDLAPDDRPREKLMRNGGRVLSDAELIAVLLGTGTRQVSAVELARILVKEYGSLADLVRREPPELAQFKGMGMVKAARLTAAFEIMRRVQSGAGLEKRTIRSPKDAVEEFLPYLRDLNKEVFKVILLNSANRILRDIDITQGTLNASLVHPREVFKAAIDHHAASIILMHNHPSGNAEPSSEDLAITEQLRQAGQVMGIPVRDHIIIAAGSFTSLAERGYL